MSAVHVKAIQAVYIFVLGCLCFLAGYQIALYRPPSLTLVLIGLCVGASSAIIPMVRK